MPQPSLNTALQNINLKKTIKSIHKSEIKFLIKLLHRIIVFPHLLFGI